MVGRRLKHFILFGWTALALLLAAAPARADYFKDLESAFMAQRRGDYDRAINIYTNIILSSDLTPQEKATIYLLRGEAETKKGQYDKAIEDFNSALKLKPRYSQALYFRGLAYEKKGFYLEAYLDVRKAKALNPDKANYERKLAALEDELAARGQEVPPPGEKAPERRPPEKSGTASDSGPKAGREKRP